MFLICLSNWFAIMPKIIWNIALKAYEVYFYKDGQRVHQKQLKSNAATIEKTQKKKYN